MNVPNPDHSSLVKWAPLPEQLSSCSLCPDCHNLVTSISEGLPQTFSFLAMTCHKGQDQTASCAVPKPSCSPVPTTPQQHWAHFPILLSWCNTTDFWYFCEYSNAAKMLSSNCSFHLFVSSLIPYLNSFLTHQRWCWPCYHFTHHLHLKVSLTQPWAHSGTSHWSSSCWSPWKDCAHVEDSTPVQWNNLSVPSKHRLHAKHPVIPTKLLGALSGSGTEVPQSSTAHSVTHHAASGSCSATWFTATSPGQQLWKQHLLTVAAHS